MCVRILFVVPYFNEERLLTECVTSITKAYGESGEMLHLELAICDNSSRRNDRLPVQLQSVTEPCGITLHILTLKPAIGFARACNAGIVFGISKQFDFIVLLNQDAKLAEDFLNSFKQIASSDIANKSVLGAVTTDHDGVLDDLFYRWYLAPFVSPNAQTFDPFVFTSNLSGSCMIFSKEVVSVLNGFDPLFHMYGEDTDLCVRAIRKNISLAIAPALKISHLHSNKTKTPRFTVRWTWKRRSNIVRLLKAGSVAPGLLYMFVTWAVLVLTLRVKLAVRVLADDLWLLRNTRFLRDFVSSNGDSSLRMRIHKFVLDDQILQ